uniref:Uncharacterized protein n=1 Tax=Hyaloperonospora arabidopsidis (strain Emoy2) TaxID=559515 RepID=M4BLT5_HYAAE
MFDYVARQYRWYKLEFGLTMLSWWEVSIFRYCRKQCKTCREDGHDNATC